MTEDRDKIVETAAVVRNEANLRLVATFTSAVNASATFAAITGVALPERVCMVRVHNSEDTKITVNPVGEADANSGGFLTPNTFDFWGKKDDLDLYELFTGVGAKVYDFFVYTRITPE